MKKSHLLTTGVLIGIGYTTLTFAVEFALSGWQWSDEMKGIIIAVLNPHVLLMDNIIHANFISELPYFFAVLALINAITGIIIVWLLHLLFKLLKIHSLWVKIVIICTGIALVVATIGWPFILFLL